MGHDDRGLGREREAMAEVDRRFGDALDRLAAMRDRAIAELRAADLDLAELAGYRVFLALILGQAIGTLDAVRILLGHGYGRRSLPLVRTLVDLEIDAMLLRIQRDAAVGYYSAFEAWELAVTAARALHIVDAADPQVAAGVERCRQDLLDALVRLQVDVPEGFSELDLIPAIEQSGSLLFGKRYPHGWRDREDHCALLTLVAAEHVRFFEPGGLAIEESDEGALLTWSIQDLRITGWGTDS